MRRRVSEARVGRLATIDSSGGPHLVPFVFVLDPRGDTIYSEVDDKPKRTKRLKRLANIRHEPRVAVIVDHYEADWDRAWWVMMRGRGRVLESGAERDLGLELLAEKYEQYRLGTESESEPGPVIAIDVELWRGWSADEGRPGNKMQP